eukprot:gene6270-6342_t
MVVQTSAERLSALDDILWTYAPESFLPHGTAPDKLTPVLLTAQDGPPDGARLRIFVDGADVMASLSDGYDRLIIMFDGNDENQLAAARRQWSALKSGGHTLAYWQQTESGGWEKKAGMAAISVVMHHFMLGFLPQYDGILAGYDLKNTLIGNPLFFFINGPAMVVIFFVLSGHVLSRRNFENPDPVYVFGAAFKRWFRDSVSFLAAVYQGSLGALLRGTCDFNTNLWTMTYEFYGSMLTFMEQHSQLSGASSMGAYGWIKFLSIYAKIGLPGPFVQAIGAFQFLIVFGTQNIVSRQFTGVVSKILGQISFPLYLAALAGLLLPLPQF